ncbi:hypothetical protein [Planococcus halocryophilus]|uniref:hypothetical protein n=1 Tax=Planococcus halocryophilus TaxID=1215089 RepID=UPI000594DAAE|nr:hypothetical protein [Planococcus halocryophilus]
MDSKHIEQTFSEVSKTTGWAVDKRISLAVTNIYLGRGQKFDARLHTEAVNVIKKMKDGHLHCDPIYSMLQLLLWC